MTRYIPIYAVMFVLLTAASCETTRDVAVSRAAEANDLALEAAEFAMCKGASVGAVQRMYGKSTEQAAAWRTLCLTDRAAAPVPFVE